MSQPSQESVGPGLKPTDLRAILKYVPRFQDQIFVIAIDGQIVADDNFPNLLLDIAVLRSLFIKVVLVHGIAHQLQQLSTLRGIPVTDVLGTGVTDAPTLDLAVRASSRVSHDIFEGLTQGGLKCALTNAVRAVPVGIVRGVDHLHTGKVEKLDEAFVRSLIGEGVVPVLQPIGFDRDGKSLRINSDLLATEVAIDLRASKIIYLTTAPGLEIAGALRREMAVDELRRVAGEGGEPRDDNLRSKALNAVRAIDSGVPRVHIVDGRVHDGLLNEIFSNEGVGTLVYGNDYQQIRKATKRDTRMIYNLTRGAVRREELVFRSLERIERNIDSFYVYEIDENLIACISLVTYPDQPRMPELASLCVMPFYQNRGVGKKMVEFALREARRRGAERVFSLTTQAYAFFTKVTGFREASSDILPEARRQAAGQSGRNARVMVHDFSNIPP